MNLEIDLQNNIMKKYISSRLLNLSFRVLSMVAKFLLIIYIGKYLSSTELGEYGLFVTTVSISMYFLGMDFYIFNSREIIKVEHHNRLSLIKDQFVFHIIVYAFVLPLLFSVFLFDIIDYKYIVFFYLIVVTEHISQELFRLYVTLSQQVLANVLLLFRTGIWVYILIILWTYGIKNTENLYSVYVAWFFGAFFSIVIGVYYLFKIYDKDTLVSKIDWIWIKHGFKISLPFLVGTIAYKVIEFSDRYMIDYYMTKSDVGIYTFFGSIANTMQTIVYTLVIMMYYPKMIELYKDSKMEEFNSTTKKFFLEVLIYSMITIIGIVIFIHPVLEYLGKVEFTQNLSVLWVLLAGVLVLNLSFVPHYILFVKHKDIAIRNITILGAVMNIILNMCLIPLFGLIGAGIATLGSYIVIYFYKLKLVCK
jgi:O-antigen/teichoic acid export membrane protein